MEQEERFAKFILPKNIQRVILIKRIHRTVEIIVLTVVTFLIAIVLFLLLNNNLYWLIPTPVIQTGLILIYYRAIRPLIENALAGTVCDPTQMHCYIREDESEETEL